ncbi:hypothetical protein M8C21_028050, partial [Ambrosia artemisiifolia]
SLSNPYLKTIFIKGDGGGSDW